MRRCLDCGAELTSEQCDNCGLTPAEAEAVLRRRLLNRTAIYLLGTVAFLPATHFYPPLELDAIFIFLGVVSFVVVSAAVWIDRRARRQAHVEALKRVCYGLLPVSWLLTGLLFLNGRFDASPPFRHATVVVGKFSMPGMLRTSRLMVHSWRPGLRIERIPIRPEELDRFQKGDAVEILVQDGLFGIPWVRSVQHK